MRILLIEDCAAQGEPLRELLRMAGHEAEWCMTGTDAIAKAGDFQPEAIVSDYVLAEKSSGLDVLRRLRAMPGLADVPAVLMTAVGGADLACVVETVARDGMRLVLVRKPLTVEELLKAIGDATCFP